MAVCLLLGILSAVNVSIVEPVDGGVYDGDWLTLRAIVQNENILPDSVTYSLNGDPFFPVPRLNTDWPTYMQSNVHNGFSESPAPHEPTVLWTAPVCGTYHEFPNPLVVNGIIYYPSNSGDGKIHALDAATGEEIWSYQTVGSDDPPSIVDGRLFSASDSIYCLESSTGARIWTFGGANDHGGTPCVLDGRVACADADWVKNETYLYCLSADDGQVIWYRLIEGYIANCMTGWNGLFFVGTYHGSLTALDAATGETVWSNEYSLDGYWDSSPVVVDSTLYIGSVNGSVWAFDCLTGNPVWSTFISDNLITATPAYHDGCLFVGTDTSGPDGLFVRMDAVSGQIQWYKAFSIHGSPCIADGLVFFGETSYPGADARIIALDCETGETVWTYSVEAQMFMGTPSVTDGIMYIPAIDGFLYAFGTGLKWTYTNELNAEIGENQLVADSWSGGSVVASDMVSFTVTDTGIETYDVPDAGPRLSAIPNPFTETTVISFRIGVQGHVSVQVFDLSGRLVRTLAGGELATGEYSLAWDGRDDSGRALPSGVYICRVTTPTSTVTMSTCLLRQ